MASIIYMGSLFGKQDHIGKTEINHGYVNKSLLNDGLIAIVSKGNIIEGIEAKE